VGPNAGHLGQVFEIEAAVEAHVAQDLADAAGGLQGRRRTRRPLARPGNQTFND
jgi:hypothetical protein